MPSCGRAPAAQARGQQEDAAHPHVVCSSSDECSSAADADSDVVCVKHAPAPPARKPLLPTTHASRCSPLSSRTARQTPSGIDASPLHSLDTTLLQQRLYAASCASGPSELNELLRAVAGRGDARAAVHVYDLLGSACVDAASWGVLRSLEHRRLHHDVFAVPAQTRRQLQPLRRIHKICKGSRTHARSEMAKEVMLEVVTWLERSSGGTQSNGQRLHGKNRRKQAHILQKELALSMSCARGVVTKLKQKKLIS